MKKLLSSLLLMFTLSFSNLSGDIGYKIENNIKLIEITPVILDNLKDLVYKKDNIIYSDLNNIPVRSPINIKQLKSLSSDYGLRKHPIFKKWMWHNGIDLSAKLGTPVHSTADGTIIDVIKSKYGYGNCITIKHNDVYKTMYAHLKTMNVNVDDTVSAGQVIGTVGSTGLSTGPHLHYEIIKNNLTIDPLYFSYDAKANRSKVNYYLLLKNLDNT